MEKNYGTEMGNDRVNNDIIGMVPKEEVMKAEAMGAIVWEDNVWKIATIQGMAGGRPVKLLHPKYFEYEDQRTADHKRRDAQMKKAKFYAK